MQPLHRGLTKYRNISKVITRVQNSQIGKKSKDEYLTRLTRSARTYLETWTFTKTRTHFENSDMRTLPWNLRVMRTPAHSLRHKKEIY